MAARRLSCFPSALTPLLVIASCRFAHGGWNVHEPHYHQGKLEPFELGPPELLLSEPEAGALSRGEPIMQALLDAEGKPRRLFMVRDVPTPADIVIGRVMDLERYGEMIQGCEGVSNYAMELREDGVQEIRSRYQVRALHVHHIVYLA